MDLLVVVGIAVIAFFVIARAIRQRAATREAERHARAARASKALADAMISDMEARVAATVAAKSDAKPERPPREPDHVHQMLGRQLVDASLRHQRETASASEQIEIDRRLAENEQAQLKLIDRLIAEDRRSTSLPGPAAGSAPAGR